MNNLNGRGAFIKRADDCYYTNLRNAHSGTAVRIPFCGGANVVRSGGAN